MEKKMEEMKKLISSILVSSPLQMTVMKLDRDYAEQIGERIPFKRFGFSSLEECLHAMPEVLEIRGSGYNAEVSVKVSSKVAHIDKLISQQRIAQPRRANFGTRPKQRRPTSRRHSAQHNSQLSPTVPQSKHIPSLLSLPTRTQPLLPLPQHRPPLLLPPNHRPPLFPLPNHRPPLFPLANYVPPYQVPYQFKYTPPTRYVQATKSAVLPIHTSSPKEPQKPYSPPPRLRQTPTFQGNLLPAGHSQQHMPEVLPSSEDSHARNTKLDADTADNPGTNGTIPKQNNFSANLPPPPGENEDVYISDSEEEDYYETDIPELPKKPVESKSLYNQIIGAVQMTELSNEPSFATSNSSNVPLSVQKNLRVLISKFDDGIWCARLPSAYLNMFKKELDFMEYKYRSLITMCMELDDIFHCIRPDKGDFKLYDKQKPLPRDYDKNVKMSELLKACNDVGTKPPTEPALADIESLMNEDTFPQPPDVVQLCENIPRQFLPDDVKEDDYIDVCVGEIYDPSKFWILLNNFTNDLDKLMDELQVFYTNCDPKYEIPERGIRLGVYCAAVYNYEYHRAIIVNVLPKHTNKVKVFYIDYGTVSAVPRKGLYYLHRQFAVLKQQAIRARLAKIYPPVAQTQWAPEAASRFLSLVVMKLLVAHIYQIDHDNSTVEIFLVDTSGEEDIYMNDTLVNEGLAIFTHQEQEITKLGLNEIPRVKQIHLYPTFEEIEIGKVPSAGEMISLARSGITLQVMYPHYFVQPFNLVNVPELDALEDQSKGVATNLRSRIFSKSFDEAGKEEAAVEPSWTELCDEESAISEEILKESLSELSLSSPSVTEASPISKSSSSPEVVYAKPVSRPPPGFEGIQPTPVQFAAPANIGPSSQDVLLMNYMLACQQNALLGSNVLPRQQVVNQPMVMPTVINQPMGYLPTTHQTLVMPTPTDFTLQQPLLQPTSNNLLYQLAMQAQMQRQNNFFNQLQNQSRKHREILQQIINQQLLNGSESLLLLLEEMVREQGRLTTGQEDTFGLLSSIIANRSLKMPHTKLSDIFSDVLNMLSDNQIVELARKANEPTNATSSSSANDDASMNLTTGNSESASNLSRNSSSVTKPDNAPSFSTDILSNLRIQGISANSNIYKSNCAEKAEDCSNEVIRQIQRQNERNKARRRCVIKTDLNKKPVHVIWFRNNAYVMINEIMQFTSKKAPIEKIRKIIVMVDPSSLVVDLPLNEHMDVTEELLRYQHFDTNSTLHIVPATFIPKIIEILGSKDSSIDYDDFLRRIDCNSDVWLTT